MKRLVTQGKTALIAAAMLGASVTAASADDFLLDYVGFDYFTGAAPGTPGQSFRAVPGNNLKLCNCSQQVPGSSWHAFPSVWCCSPVASCDCRERASPVREHKRRPHPFSMIMYNNCEGTWHRKPSHC